jgi:outer membrane protein OmpA-like peptidoglycan-associated protein
MRRRRYPWIALSTCSLVALLLMSRSTAQSQLTEGRWRMGFGIGTNLFLSDLDVQKIAPAGELSLRYGITQAVSLGLTLGYDELKAVQRTPTLQWPGDYQLVRGYDAALMVHVHFLTLKNLSPFCYAGGGLMAYKTLFGDGTTLRGDDKLNSTYIFPLGLGCEWFFSREIALSGKIGYSFVNDLVDKTGNGGPDGFASARIGLSFSLGSSDLDDDDGDGLTNGQEKRLGTDQEIPDTDGDRLKDGEEVKRYLTNPLVVDTDGDGLGDGEEVFVHRTDPTKFDTDGDGLSDGEEELKYKTAPLKPDTDGDGLTDGEEVYRTKTDPLRIDSDSDGLSDWDESRVNKTNPIVADTDGDGLRDGDEVKLYKTDPLRADTDRGGVNDGIEVQRGTNPLDPNDDFPRGTLPLERGKSLILEGVSFEGGTAILTRDSEKALQTALRSLSAIPYVKVEIAGYTDGVGEPATNESLSLRRAEAVRQWLVVRGIDPLRLTTAGYGARSPIATNITAEGRARNRRIELHVK